MSQGLALPLTSIIPRSDRFYFLSTLAGTAAVVLLCSLYIASFSFGSLTTDGTIAAFDLDAEGSIACWASITVLLGCSLAALLIRRLRASLARTKSTHGAWLAVAGVWLIMSMDEGSSLHEGFKEMMTRITGTRLIGDGSVYWAVPYFLMLSVTGCFLLVQFRREPGAVLFLCTAGLCHGFAVIFQLEWLLRGVWPAQIVAEEAAEMLGYIFILMAHGIHLRALANRCDVLTEPIIDTARTVPAPHFVASANTPKT